MAIYTFYKICCNAENEFVYVGSTINFTSRKNQHKRSCEKPKQQELNMKIYVTIREFGGWDNWTMVLIEYFPCETSLEASSRERYWYDQFNAKLNAQMPNRTTSEYNQQHVEYYKDYNKEHYLQNKQQYRQRAIRNKDKIAKRMKKYNEQHKVKIAERKQLSYRQNKISRNIENGLKMICELDMYF